MKIVKRFKAIPKEMEFFWMLPSGKLGIKEIEREGKETINDYEYEKYKYKYKVLFEPVDDELVDEIKKARGFNGIMKLYKKYNKEAIKEYVDREIKKHEKEIERLKKYL